MRVLYLHLADMGMKTEWLQTPRSCGSLSPTLRPRVMPLLMEGKGVWGLGRANEGNRERREREMAYSPTMLAGPTGMISDAALDSQQPPPEPWRGNRDHQGPQSPRSPKTLF
jgi:hypothetical protein